MSGTSKLPTISDYMAKVTPKERWELIKGLHYHGWGGLITSEVTGNIIPYDSARDSGAVHNSALKDLYRSILNVETDPDIRHEVESRLTERSEKTQLLRQMKEF
jgi:hypothetical protein